MESNIDNFSGNHAEAQHVKPILDTLSLRLKPMKMIIRQPNNANEITEIGEKWALHLHELKENTTATIQRYVNLKLLFD